MEQFLLDTKQPQIIRLAEEEEFSEDACKILLFSEKEFIESGFKMERRNVFLRNLESVHYCKMEKFSEDLLGTMKIPGHERKKRMRFVFYLSGNTLVLVEKEGNLREIFKKIKDRLYENGSLLMFLLVLFKYILEQDLVYLKNKETHLEQLEEDLLKEIPDGFEEKLMSYRREFSRFHEYYQQVMAVSEVMQDSMGRQLDAEEMMAWQHYADQAERFHDNIEMLKDYVVQIRELYQSRIAQKQNDIMNFLTIVTTIFFPLTLITGWYGMNFLNMPELAYKYAYPIIILASAGIIVFEITFFRKKKMI